MNQDVALLKYLATVDKSIGKLYEKLINELAKIGATINDLDTQKLFSFSDYPSVKNKVEKILDKYTETLTAKITNGMTEAVNMSYLANTTFLKDFSKLSDKALKTQRETAANAFIQSRTKSKDGLSLSDKVWNYTRQSKAEFEAGMSEVLEDGISSGISAEELGRKVRDKLKQPDMVYRRYHLKKLTKDGKKDIIEWRKKIIDEDGKVHYIKTDMEKVGAGVYRSSRKNALRLAATEINMAYRYADCVRWQSEPFIRGIRIRLSENHTCNGKPFYDICDELAGDYPKDFLWQGWHPACRCSASPILISDEEMDALSELSEEEYQSYKPKDLITDTPQAFKDWIENNKERFIKAQEDGKLPYWAKDNPKYVNKVLNEEDMPIKRGKTIFKTDEQKAVIQKAWDERRRKNAILAAAEKRHASRDAEEIQQEWRERRQWNYDTEIQRMIKEELHGYDSKSALHDRWRAVADAIRGDASVSVVNSLYDKVKAGINIQKRWDLREDILWEVPNGLLDSQRWKWISEYRQFAKETGFFKIMPMSFEAADALRGNPLYRLSKEFRINCQSAVVAYEMRRKGFDVRALGNLKGSMSEQLSHNTAMAWVDFNGNIPKQTLIGAMATKRMNPCTGETWYSYSKTVPNRKRLIETLEAAITENGRYHISWDWESESKTSRHGHIICLDKIGDKIRYYDPQNGKVITDMVKYIENIDLSYGMRLLRVDNLRVNNDVVKGVLTKYGAGILKGSASNISQTSGEQRKNWQPLQELPKEYKSSNGGLVTIPQNRLDLALSSKQEYHKYSKEWGMAKNFTDDGSIFEFSPSADGYDGFYNGIRADLKSTKSANHILDYAKEATRKQGAKIVLFEFTADTPKIREAIAELARKGFEGKYYFSSSPKIKYDI